jgi:hypothetical protein
MSINPYGPSTDTVRAVFAALPADEQASRRAQEAQEEALYREYEANKAAEAAAEAKASAAAFAQVWDHSFDSCPMWDEDGHKVAQVTVDGAYYGGRMSVLGYEGPSWGANSVRVARRDGTAAAGDVVARGDAGEEWSLRGLGIVQTATSEWMPANARTQRDTEQANARKVQITDDASRDLAFTGGQYSHACWGDFDQAPTCWDQWVDPVVIAARMAKAAKKAAKQQDHAAAANPFAALASLVRS